MTHLLVDAMNVIGSRPTGWWRDRDGAVRALLARLQALAHADGVGITMFVDGRALADIPPGAHNGVDVVYAARGGRNAADDSIVAFVAADAAPANLEVVTSDRALSGRATALGAGVSRPSALLDRLDQLEP
jgi:hypothetical protein